MYINRPLSISTIKKVFNSLQKHSEKRTNFGGYIPPYVLGYKEGVKHNKFLWRSEPGIKDIFFTKQSNIKSHKYHVPGLVWFLENELSIYAYKEWKELKTELFYAPFLNVSKEVVCLGTANEYVSASLRNAHCFTDTIKALEIGFWNSYFSHTGTFNKQISGSFIDYYSRAKTAIPYELLTPANILLENLIQTEFNEN